MMDDQNKTVAIDARAVVQEIGLAIAEKFLPQ
jgi:hypothetical protein